MSTNCYNILSNLSENNRDTPKSNNSQKDKSTHEELKNQNSRRPLVPTPVLYQNELRKKYNYSYKLLSNGNVENNSTIYVSTSVAHPHQVENIIKNAINKAKNMPKIFGYDFECDFQINVVRRYTGEYLGYAFVDFTNPKFYYALTGYNVDGSERVEYKDDPNWISPKDTSTITNNIDSWNENTSWADIIDELDLSLIHI